MQAATVVGDGSVTTGHVEVHSAVVTMGVPQRGKEVVLSRPDGEMRCMRFKYTVIGGCVYAYISIDLFEAHKGQNAELKVGIWKDIQNGEVRETYIMLSASERSATCKLRVLQGSDIPHRYWGRDVQKFGVGKSRGLIVLYPR